MHRHCCLEPSTLRCSVIALLQLFLYCTVPPCACPPAHMTPHPRPSASTGSERIAKSEVVGAQLKEAQAINKSLSALGDVIAALQSRGKGGGNGGGGGGHVPYRNSKLTQVLQDSLCGSSKVLLVCCISPEAASAAESLSSLNFAARAAQVTNDIGRPTASVVGNRFHLGRTGGRAGTALNSLLLQQLGTECLSALCRLVSRWSSARSARPTRPPLAPRRRAALLLLWRHLWGHRLSRPPRWRQLQQVAAAGAGQRARRRAAVGRSSAAPSEMPMLIRHAYIVSVRVW